MTPAYEVNFDGLVGPTHNYAGLAYGNIASQTYAGRASNPKAAALQGLAKMKFCMDLGLKQAVLPPQERPHLPTLRKLGFTGSDAEIIAKASTAMPLVFANVCSASSMWTANAATVSPSADTEDGKVHFTPANLIHNLHRSIEPPMTASILRRIFPDDAHFVHHDPLPTANMFSDEGAANHSRLCRAYGRTGIEIFTYGRNADQSNDAPEPSRFPARQSAQASQAVARSHALRHTIALQQNPAAIDAGVFHNDVVALANQNVFFHHELAYVGPNALDELKETYRKLHDRDPVIITVKEDEVSLADAVASYLFNSQLVTLPDASMAIICPTDCMETESTRTYLEKLLQLDNPITAVHPIDVRQSMQNGGGPACLRLRIVLTDAQLQATHPSVFLTESLYEQLVDWVQRHYRESLKPGDMSDPAILTESRDALHELTTILSLGNLYEF